MRHTHVRAGAMTTLCAILGIAMLLTACGGGDSADATPTIQRVVTENSPTAEPPTPTATAEPATPTPSPEPTATPEPEPSATPTRSGPAPTVAAPIQRQPTAIPPAPTPEPEPEPTVDDGSGDVSEPTIGALLMESDLSDWEQVELEFGSGFVAGGSYHIHVTDPEGAFIILRSNQNDFGNVLVSLDVRMVSASTDAYGCVTARADFDYQYNYAMCITSAGETRAIYEYFDENENYFSETLFDFEVREGTNPATEWNNLAIIAFGEELGFFVNDTFLGLATHTGPAVGSVGFYVENYDVNGAEFEFANLQVWAVE